MADIQEELQFSDPPVREMSLNILLETMPALSLLDLASFRTGNSSLYPHADELAPLQAWDDDGDESIPLISGQTKWPLPLCTLGSPAKDRQLFFQADRFGISWSFGLDAPAYPGFKSLLEEMMQGFESFAASIANSGNSIPSPHRISIRYTNELVSITPDDMVNALLNGWPLPERRKPTRAGMTSARIHQCESSYDKDVALLFIVDPFDDDNDVTKNATEHSGHAMDSCVFRIGGDMSVSGDLDIASGFNRMHAAVLREFVESMGDETIQKWGRK